MTLSAVAVIILAALFPSAAQAATVWKCKDGDRVIFSDAPCPSTGAPIEARRLQSNVVGAHPVPSQRATDPEPLRQVDGGVATSRSAPQRPASVCPSEQEIRNMELSARSATRSAGDVKFRKDEIRRARQCQQGQGTYTANDWQTSREAQAAQGSSIDRVKSAAKAKAEAAHTAANPIEGDRIQRERTERLERALAVPADTAPSPPAPTTISSCNSTGCWTNSGQRLRRIQGTDQLVGTRGKCKVVDNRVHCP